MRNGMRWKERWTETEGRMERDESRNEETDGCSPSI